MKTVLANHLFIRLGLLISACALSDVQALDNGNYNFDLSSPTDRRPSISSLEEDSTAKELQKPSVLFSLEYPEFFPAVPSESFSTRIFSPLTPNQSVPVQTPPTAIEENPPQPATVPPPTDQIFQQNQVAEETVSPPGPAKTILINFNNVSIIEFIRFISRISNKNFIFDEADLQFNVTIVSEQPTTIENIMTALLQELRIHDLTLIEQGNNLIIHKNPKVNSVSKVIANDLFDGTQVGSAEIVTQVFTLNTLEPERAAALIRPLISERALVEFVHNNLIVTDLVSNVQQISKLIKSLDSPTSGLVIGQYVIRVGDIDTLLPMIQRIMQPISQDQPLTFVPYPSSNSIFIVSTPFLVERSISILQHLDQESGKTRIIDLKELKFQPPGGAGRVPGAPGGVLPGQAQGLPPGIQPGAPGTGWEFGPGGLTSEQMGREGINVMPLFIPVEVPVEKVPSTEELELLEKAKLALPPPPTHVGITHFVLPPPPIPTETIERIPETNEEFVARPVKQTRFYIHKLQYRRGDLLMANIQAIGASLQNVPGHEDFLVALNTVQWLVDGKALVFSGTIESLDKVRELLDEIDIPLRQVFIEMLILDTSVDDSLNYSVNLGSRFGGGGQAGAQLFRTGASTLPSALNTTGVTGLGQPRPNNPDVVPFNEALIPDPRGLNAGIEGFSLGIIGEHIIHKGLGLRFNSIGALVRAIHSRTTDRIVLSPKIITEDNVPAQIFVGFNTPFKTQSIANNLGSFITNNFEFRDVGNSLQVTPHIYSSDLVTLEIIQESSSILPSTGGGDQNSNQFAGPTTKKNTTRTTVNIPNGYFCILSGMMNDEDILIRTQVPCLGNVPLLGAAFSDRAETFTKRNLMLFLRPVIVDTDEEIQNITRHEQDIWEYKNEVEKMWIEETEGALDFLNVRQTLKTDDEDDPDCRQFAH